MYGVHIAKSEHGWDINDPGSILESYVLPIVDSTDSIETVQCTTGKRWVKYQNDTGIFVLLQDNEYSSLPPYRVYDSYPMEPEDAVKWIIRRRWILDN